MPRTSPSNTRPANPAPATRRRVKLAQAVEYSGASPSTLRRMIRDGRLPAYRFGTKMVLVDLNDIDALATRIPSGGVAS